MSQSPTSHLSTQKNLILGLILGIATYIIVPVGDGLAKILATQGYDSGQITFGRYFFHMLFLLPIVLTKFGPQGLIPNNLKMQSFRALTIIFATFCFFSALKTIPLADALALVFVTPLVVTILSGPLLGEKVGRHRWIATIIGFAGAVVIIQPGSSIFQWTAFYALGGGMLFGLYITITRKTAGDNPALISLLYQGVVGVFILSFIAFIEWKAPTSEAILLVAGVGACAAIGHGLLIMSTQYIEASLLAPLQYIELLIGALFGYLVFGTIPPSTTWIGAAIVILSGLYIGYRERKIKRA